MENNSSYRLLHCWNASRQEYFKNEYEWLHIANNENVGCQWCTQVGSLNVESGKHRVLLNLMGQKKEILQTSIRKKKSWGSNQNIISIYIYVTNEKFLHIFNTAYFIIKNNKPFTDFPNLIINKNNADLGISSK